MAIYYEPHEAAIFEAIDFACLTDELVLMDMTDEEIEEAMLEANVVVGTVLA